MKRTTWVSLVATMTLALSGCPSETEGGNNAGNTNTSGTMGTDTTGTAMGATDTTGTANATGVGTAAMDTDTTGTMGTDTTGTMGTDTTGTMGTDTTGTMGTDTTGTMGTDTTGTMDTDTTGTDAMSADAGTMTTDGGTMTELTPSEQCVADAAEMGETDDCTVCGCNNCLEEVMNCQDEACRSIVDCGRTNGCEGTGCYCGTADTLVCAITMTPNGACKEVIVEASGLVADGTCTDVDACAVALNDLGDNDPTNAVVRARALSICTQGQKADDGIPGLVEALPAIDAMCGTECGSP